MVQGRRVAGDDRLTGLDFMRVLACMLVLFHHLFQRFYFEGLTGVWNPLYLFFNMGSFGVGIFFLLSGFLLARPFWQAFDAGRPMPSLVTFALRRAARIVPGFYVALVVSFLVAVIPFGVPVTGELLLRFATGFTFLGAFHPVTLFPTEMNGPLWSISLEVIAYALLPVGLTALFALRQRLPGWKGRLTFLAVVLVALFVHYLVKTHVPVVREGWGWQHGLTGGAKYWMPNYNPAGFFVFFALGALAAGTSLLWTRGRTVAADILAVAALLSAAGSMWGAAPERLPEALGWLNLPYAFPRFHLAIAVALMTLPHAKFLPRLLEARPVAFLAQISFGIYIWHTPIMELVRLHLAPDFYYAGVFGVEHWLVTSQVVIVLTLLAATASWYLVEAPALRWARRFAPGGLAGRQNSLHSAATAALP